MITQAIILAGGLGTRLRSVVHDLPKPMAPVAGKPFLYYLLRFLSHYGIQKTILSVGYRHEAIIDYFGHQFEQMQLKYAIEEVPLGTGGGIRMACDLLENESFFLLNGDSFIDVNLKDMANEFHASEWDVLLAACRLPHPARYGTLECAEQRIIQFREKDPSLEAGLINAGVYLMNKHVITDRISTGEKASFEQNILEKGLKELKMGAFTSDAYFIDIGIPEDYEKSQHDFLSFRY